MVLRALPKRRRRPGPAAWAMKKWSDVTAAFAPRDSRLPDALPGRAIPGLAPQLGELAEKRLLILGKILGRPDGSGRTGRRAGGCPAPSSPWPRMRKTWPDWVPAGILSFSPPSNVGISTVTPRAAWATEIAISQVRWWSFAVEEFVRPGPGSRCRGPRARLRSPPPRPRRRSGGACPSLDAGRDADLEVRASAGRARCRGTPRRAKG